METAASSRLTRGDGTALPSRFEIGPLDGRRRSRYSIVGPLNTWPGCCRCQVGGHVNRRRDARGAVPKLRHDEAVQYLVEYHFGRLAPQLNAAVEAHIRECAICQRQGLSHAATEKRDVARRLRRVRPTKQRLTGKVRGVIIFLAIIAILQVGVYELSRGSGSPLGSLFAGHSPRVAATPTATATPLPLTASLTYGAASANTDALALSPDGKTLAAASLNGASPVVTLWTAATGKAGAALSWPGQVAPGVLAWSPDGKTLAAADGSLVGVWVPPAATPAWTLTLPAAPALRVYDAQAGSLQQEPDSATAFASSSLLRWSPTGSLSIVAPAAGAGSPVTTSGGQQIDLWRTEGTHLYADGTGGALVGVSGSDVSKHEALLSWSPDGHFLLWASVSRPVAVPAPKLTSTPSPSATAGTSSASKTAVPDAVVGSLASDIATSGHGDVLVWFSPDGHYLASCDRAASPAALDVYDIAVGRIVSQLTGVCAALNIGSVAWSVTPSALIVAIPGKPIAVYSLGAVTG